MSASLRSWAINVILSGTLGGAGREAVHDLAAEGLKSSSCARSWRVSEHPAREVRERRQRVDSSAVLINNAAILETWEARS